MEHHSVWRTSALMMVLVVSTGCFGDIRPVAGPPIDGFEPGIILEAQGAVDGSLVISEDFAVFVRTRSSAINPGWVMEGVHADEATWSGSLVSVGRGEAGVGQWEYIQPEPGEEWEGENRDVIGLLDPGTAWLVLNYSGEQGDMSLLSVSGTFEVVKTNEHWAAGYITVSMIEQDFETGQVVENPRQATLQGTFNIRFSTMGDVI